MLQPNGAAPGPFGRVRARHSLPQQIVDDAGMGKNAERGHNVDEGRRAAEQARLSGDGGRDQGNRTSAQKFLITVVSTVKAPSLRKVEQKVSG